MSDAFVAIWTRQYIRPRDIGDRLHLTEARLTKMVNDAYEEGHKDGVLADRHKLCAALDEQHIDLSRFKFPDLSVPR